MVKGIDVSSHQGDINWSKVKKAGYEFAIIKATEGKDWRDPTCTSARYQAMKKAGIITGFYHFARPGNKPARTGTDEANHFYNTVKKVTGKPNAIANGDLPLVLDIETSATNPRETKKFCDQFCTRIKKLTGRGCIVYTSPGIWNAICGLQHPVFGQALWAAHYGVTTGFPGIPKGWKRSDLLIHQYSDKGSVPGVSGKCDVNVWTKDINRLKTFVGVNPAPRKPPKPKPENPHVPPRSKPVLRSYYLHPWWDKSYKSEALKKWCNERGLISPHFTWAEWKSKDGKPVPPALQFNARRAAFRLEKLRHELGDKPLSALSYYRSPEHNRRVGGAKSSRHMSADAADFSVATVNKFGRSRFLAAAEKYYKNDGVGIYPGGNIHLDTRGSRARWSSW